MYIRTPEVIYLITESLLPLTNISPSSPHPNPSNPHSTLSFNEFDFFAIKNIWLFYFRHRVTLLCFMLAINLKINLINTFDCVIKLHDYFIVY